MMEVGEHEFQPSAKIIKTLLKLKPLTDKKLSAYFAGEKINSRDNDAKFAKKN